MALDPGDATSEDVGEANEFSDTPLSLLVLVFSFILDKASSSEAFPHCVEMETCSRPQCSETDDFAIWFGFNSS